MRAINTQALTPSNMAPPVQHLSLVTQRCVICDGMITELEQGTRYCCDAAELVALRALSNELDRNIAVELEDPPADAHAVRALSYLRSRVRRVRRMA